MQLSELATLLLGGEEPLPGLMLSPEDAALLATLKFPGKPYCLVKDWVLIDVTLSASEQAAFGAKRYNPTFLYARYVVLDSRGRFQEGDWVRSTFELCYEPPGWFLTKNTLYILLGNGGRQTGDLTCYRAFS